VSSNSRTDVPEQNHEAMRAAALRPIRVETVGPTQTAGGRLPLPEREKNDHELPNLGIHQTQVHEPIPGEHDATTLTHREAGAIGGAFNGEDNRQANAGAVMDKQTLRDRVREGGGLEAERRFDKQGGR
jgi:hypothetical protein